VGKEFLALDKELILQFRVKHRQVSDEEVAFRQRLEDELHDALSQQHCGMVHGGSVGNGKLNIFVFTKSWESAIDVVLGQLRQRKLHDKAILAKSLDDGHYEVVWPENYRLEFTTL
jgi:hypothetical protein